MVAEAASDATTGIGRSVTMGTGLVCCRVRGLLPEEKHDGSFVDGTVRTISQVLQHAEVKTAMMLRGEQEPANRHAAVLSRHFTDEQLMELYHMQAASSSACRGGAQDDAGRVQRVITSMLLINEDEEKKATKVRD